MSTKLITFFALIASMLFNAQNYEEEAIFERTKENFIVIKSSVDKEIKKKIAPRIEKKLLQMVMQQKDGYQFLDSKDKEYVRDTLTINEYIREYNNYYAASTTFGMNRGLQFYNTEYDKLLNKYYQKTLQLLQPDMKKQLINSQKKWLKYYTNERAFINNLQDFGNHNFLVYASSYTDKLLVDRVQFLVDIYQRKMHGNFTYKE